MIEHNIRHLLDNIEQKVKLHEIKTDKDIQNLVTSEIHAAINLKYKKGNTSDKATVLSQRAPYTTLENYVNHLKALEQKLQQPYAISAQGQATEEREINRRLLLILNRLKGYSRK